jgi:preprotein translocase subunit YajC
MKLRKKDFNFIIYAIILTTVGCFLLQQPKSKSSSNSAEHAQEVLQNDNVLLTFLTSKPE